MGNRYKAVERKAEEEFLDSRFTRLADRFYGDFEHPPEDTDWIDRRFSSGPAEVDALLKDEIVRFANEDADAQRILAAAGVRDQSAKSGFRTRTKRGKWQGTAVFDENQRVWVFDVTREDGSEVKTLFIHGPGPDDPDAAKTEAARKLTEYDKTAQVRVLGPDKVLLIQRLASRDPSEAFEQGLALLFADIADEAGPGFNPFEVVAKEEFQPVLRELTLVIFLGSKLGDKMSAEQAEQFQSFADKYVGDRPWNLSIVQAAFEAFKNKTVVDNLQELDRKISQPEMVTPADLDAMSDDQVDEAFDSVSRAYIKATRHRR